MINKKDLLFGLVNRGDKSELIINSNNPKVPQMLMGVLSFLAATDETFYLALKSVIENIDENGDDIRQKIARAQAEGKMVVKEFNEGKYS